VRSEFGAALPWLGLDLFGFGFGGVVCGRGRKPTGPHSLTNFSCLWQKVFRCFSVDSTHLDSFSHTHPSPSPPVFFAGSYLVYKRQLLFVYEPEYETGGAWPGVQSANAGAFLYLFGFSSSFSSSISNPPTTTSSPQSPTAQTDLQTPPPPTTITGKMFKLILRYTFVGLFVAQFVMFVMLVTKLAYEDMPFFLPLPIVTYFAKDLLSKWCVHSTASVRPCVRAGVRAADRRRHWGPCDRLM
jgi:hypothetical protein